MDYFNNVVGQKRVKKLLEVSVVKNRMAHAYLFHGPSGAGMDAVAIAMGRGLHCEKEKWGCNECGTCQKVIRLEYPAFRLILPVPSKLKSMKEAKYQEIIREKALSVMRNPYRELNYQPELKTLPVIGIEQIRSLKKDTMLKLTGEQYRVVIISQAEKMTIPASNSLLKLLEEPPKRTLIILTTSMYKRMLPTIVSRCRVIRFDPLLEHEIEKALTASTDVTSDKAKLIAALSGGNMTKAISLIGEKYEEIRSLAFAYLQRCVENDGFHRILFSEKLVTEKNKVEVLQILHALLMWLRDIFYCHTGNYKNVINKDNVTEIDRFHEKWPAFNVGRAVERTEQAIDFIEKNVYLHLIIQTLSQEIFLCRDS